MLGDFRGVLPKRTSHAKTLSHISKTQAARGNVLDRFNFAPFDVTLVAHLWHLLMDPNMRGLYEAGAIQSGERLGITTGTQ